MKKRYDPARAIHRYDEFEAVRLSRKGGKLARETEVFLGAEPSIKERLAAKAFSALFRGPEIAAAVTFGASRLAFQPPSPHPGQSPAHSARPFGHTPRTDKK